MKKKYISPEMDIIEFDTKTIKKLYEVIWGDVHEYGYELWINIG